MVMYQEGTARNMTFTAGWSLKKGLEQKHHAFHCEAKKENFRACSSNEKCLKMYPSQEMAVVRGIQA